MRLFFFGWVQVVKEERGAVQKVRGIKDTESENKYRQDVFCVITAKKDTVQDFLDECRH